MDISGAWRLWFEHPATIRPSSPLFRVTGNTNPSHSFEIHPITKFASNDLTNTYKVIPGFTPYEAEKAFAAYEKLTISVQSTSTAITLTAKKSGYNYVQFTMRIIGKPKKNWMMAGLRYWLMLPEPTMTR